LGGAELVTMVMSFSLDRKDIVINIMGALKKAHIQKWAGQPLIPIGAGVAGTV